MVHLAFRCLGLAILAARIAIADPQSPFAQQEPPPAAPGKYRIWFTKTFGDDHMCLTEIEFYDKAGGRVNARLVSMTSCYGCNTCDGCVHRYGNPAALFDGVSTSDEAESWACTAPGTFSGETGQGVGAQNVVFILDQQPQFYVLQRPQVNGDWVTKDWSLEMEDPAGNWLTLDLAEDQEKRPDQKRNVTGIPKPNRPDVPINPPWDYATPEKWVDDYPACGGRLQSPINLESMSEMTGTRGTDSLPFDHQPLHRRALANSGKGLQVAGNLGNLTLWDGVYRASQFNFHSPPEHIIGNLEVQSLSSQIAMGELQIVFQREGARLPTDGLAIVSVMLHLPLEHELLKDEEKWFIDMGLLAIPDAGKYTLPLQNPIDFSILNHVFEGNFWHYTGSLTTPPCTEGVQYFVMENFALISGVVISQFKEKFPGNTTSRPLQNTNGRPVLVNQLPGPTVSDEIL